MQAKKAITELGYLYEGAKKLLVDELFLNCLDEEIEAFWKESILLEAVLSFSISPSGEISYQGILESVSQADKSALTIKIVKEATKEKSGLSNKEIVEKLLKSASKQRKEIIEATNSVVDKFDKMLVEALTDSVEDTSEEIKAKKVETVNMSILEKKQRLLDKLLMEKK